MNSFIMVFILALLVFSPNFTPEAHAEPSKRKIIKLEKRVNRLQKKLNRLFGKLSTSTKSKVVSARSGKSDDSDSDGVPDNFENEQGRCDSDSDDDGVDDGEEYEDGSDPYDDDSDDDGHSDGDEVERKGLIESIDSTQVVIDGIAFQFDFNTDFQGDDDEKLTASDFSQGECAEVEGHIINGSSEVVADKLEKDDDC